MLKKIVDWIFGKKEERPNLLEDFKKSEEKELKASELLELC